MGSTSNEFKVRFRNHKSATLANETTCEFNLVPRVSLPPTLLGTGRRGPWEQGWCELAVHFNRVEHMMSDFEFIVIEKVVNESEDHIDRRLLTRKAFCCSQLCTLHPQGLNERSEFNSKK